MMFGIERNKHPAGRASNALFGLVSAADGAVRALSLGLLHTRWTSSYARWQTRQAIAGLKRRRPH